jgi:RHS repeat-associated protein
MSYNQAGELSSVSVAATTSTSDTLSGGGYQTISLKSDGTVWVWGDNSHGQLGIGSTTSISTPEQVTGLSGITAVVAGGFHSVALKSDGTVWTMGSNQYGQLGIGGTTNSLVPVQVGGLSGITAIAAGDQHTLALKSDGTVWAWGYNAYGQLGNGTTTNSSTPVEVSGLTNVVAIACGAYHSLALKADGTVWTWGDDSAGQLGNGSTRNSSTPVQVSGLTNVVQIANGDKYFGEALKSDGTVWTWGDNSNGELGNGNHTASSVPIKVSSLSGITEVSGGYRHSVVLKSDGTVWTWGENSQGDLGNGTLTDSSVPVQAQGITSAIAVSAGIFHSLALLSGGAVWAWGADQSGQLGNDSLNNSLVPTQSQMTGVAPPKSLATNLLSATYTYDGNGLRESKTVNGTAESFVWNTVTPGGNPELVVDGTTNYVYGPDGLPLEQISSSGTVLYYLHDQLGSTRAITNSSGSVIVSYTYNPFGTLAATSGSLPTGDTNPFGFAGTFADSESGFLYLINRYYDPTTGQFVSVDPLVGVTGESYVFTNDNPLNEIDPLGQTGIFIDPNGICKQRCGSSGEIFQVCVDLAIVSGCVAVDNHGSFYVSSGYGIGIPGVAVSETLTGCNNPSKIETGLSATIEGNFVAGLGVTFSPKANNPLPLFEIGTPGAGFFIMSGKKIF